MGRQYSVFILRQKLANLNATLGFGRNDQHGAAMSKIQKDTSVCRNVHISISASWSVGELVCRRLGCWRVGLLASCPVIAQLNRQPTEIIYILAAKWRFAWTSL